MAFDYRDEFYIEPTWELLAKNNKLSMLLLGQNVKN